MVVIIIITRAFCYISVGVIPQVKFTFRMRAYHSYSFKDPLKFASTGMAGTHFIQCVFQQPEIELSYCFCQINALDMEAENERVPWTHYSAPRPLAQYGQLLLEEAMCVHMTTAVLQPFVFHREFVEYSWIAGARQGGLCWMKTCQYSD